MSKSTNILIKVLEALETHSTNIRGVRGYGPGTHPHFGTDSPRTVGNRTNLGKSKYEEAEEVGTDEDDTKVKVSRAFENEE